MAGATIITGVSSGIGLETAIYLAQRGFRVVGTMRDPGKSAALDAAAQQAGVAIDVFPLDLHDSASIEKTIGDIASKYGSIDALVNNAGLQLRGYFEDLTEQEIRGVFETNLFGTMAVTRSVLPRMRAARRGRMVFISSVGGLVGSPGLSAYCASKFALEGFADSLSFEMALFGVHVSIVEPGLIPTPCGKPICGLPNAAMTRRVPIIGISPSRNASRRALWRRRAFLPFMWLAPSIARCHPRNPGSVI